MLLNCIVEEDSWEFLGLQGDQTSQSYRKSILNIHYRDWSWNSNTMATWWEELTYWKRLWCWERLKAGGDGDDRAWDSWMASPTQWIGVWASSLVCCSSWGHRVGHDWATELNWWITGLCRTELGKLGPATWFFTSSELRMVCAFFNALNKFFFNFSYIRTSIFLILHLGPQSNFIENVCWPLV